jgi:hypothetical protein
MLTSIARCASLAALVLMAPALASAQPTQPFPRSFVASPDIYKVIAQNNEYKVIAVTWKPGQKDVMHSHPSNAVYYLTDCSLRIHAQDGTFRDAQPKAGGALIQGQIGAHILENIGAADCRLIMFEPA